MLYKLHKKLLVQNQKRYAFGMMTILVMIIVGSFIALDLYIPSLPSITHYFATTTGNVKLTITIYLLSFLLLQLVYGPLSDAFGRRKMILTGLSVYALGSIFCVFAPTIHWLIWGRFLQGAGVAAGASLVRVILRDIYEGKKLAQTISVVSSVIAVTPAIAPTIGGYVEYYLGWRWSFIIMLIYVSTMLVMMFFVLPESNKNQQRHALHPKTIFYSYKKLFLQRYFMGYVICSGMGLAGMIMYYSLTPFLFQGVYHIQPVVYGWLAFIVAITIFFGKVINIYLLRKMVLSSIVACSTVVMFISALSMLIIGLIGISNITVVLIPMMFFTTGISINTSNTFALAFQKKITGVGYMGAFFGFMQTVGMFVSGLVAVHISEANQIPLAITLVLFSSIAWIGQFLARKEVGETG